MSSATCKKPKYGKKTKAMDVVEGMDLSGKTYFITGANAGIGYETTRALALHGAHVVMGCRSPMKAQDARGAILREKPDAKIDLIQLDNGNLNSVYECARQYIANGWPLHCLILNAGVYNPEPRITGDGFESTFQTNHLAHFILVNLLTPLLIANAPSRIVLVSSEAHRSANVMKLSPSDITLDYLSPVGDGKKLNSAYVAYGLSKLCNIWHAKALHARLAERGVTVNTLHPGVIKTNIQNNSKLLLRFMSIAKPWMKTIEEGAATTVFCAVDPDLSPSNGGLYYDDCHPRSPTGSAQRPENAEKLWSLSETIVKQHQERTGVTA